MSSWSAGWIYATEKKVTSITCILDGVNDGTDWGGRRKTITWYYKESNLPEKDKNGKTNWVDKGTSYIPSGYNSGGELKATELKANTEYEINAHVSISEGSSYFGYDLDGIATTKQGWSWSFPTLSGSPFALTPTEWDNFRIVINNTRKANDFHKYPFTPIENCKITPLGMPYWVLLQVVNAINEVSHNLAPQLKTVESGDKFYGWWFDHLANALNSIL